MRTVTAVLTNKAGDEIGRCFIPDWEAAAAGEPGDQNSQPVEQEVAGLEDAIRQTLASEGLELLIDQTDFEISVAQALLDEDGPEVLVRLPVDAPADSPAHSATETLDPSALFAGLFDDDWPLDPGGTDA